MLCLRSKRTKDLALTEHIITREFTQWWNWLSWSSTHGHHVRNVRLAMNIRTKFMANLLFHTNSHSDVETVSSRFHIRAQCWEFKWSHKRVLIIYMIDQIWSEIHEQTITINGTDFIFSVRTFLGDIFRATISICEYPRSFGMFRMM